MANRSFFGFFSTPVVRAEEPEEEEEEVVDPQATLREECGKEHHIASLYDVYQECNERVNGKSQTTETCVQELFDYMHELDHCVAHTLFSKLK